MHISDIIGRSTPPQPWAEGEKIPWDEPGFSARMLREHLSQAHDAASRRGPLIDRHVAAIHAMLGGRPGRILDLGCGPGLYTSRLARLGHTCVGIDFGPASVAHARAEAAAEGLACTYEQADIREAAYGEGHDLVMLIFGELNAFRPDDAGLIVGKARAALSPGGLLLLELSTAEAVRAKGEGPATWQSAPAGLFADRPHILLRESFWDAGLRAATERYFVIDGGGAVERHCLSTQAYSEDEQRELLAGCGLREVRHAPSLSGDGEVFEGFQVVTAQR